MTRFDLEKINNDIKCQLYTTLTKNKYIFIWTIVNKLNTYDRLFREKK